MRKRVVVTGLGVVSSIGIGKDAFWDGLIKGKSGISEVTATVERALPFLESLLGDVAVLEEQLQNLSVPGYENDEDVLETRRNIEYTLQQYIDRILRFSVTIDRISIGIAGVHARTAGASIAELRELAAVIDMESTAWIEVESPGS